jgi:N-acetylneuraminic acid mutarotase
MSVSHPAVKAVPAALLSLYALLALSISLLLTACGGGGNSGGGIPTPTPTPSTANEWTWMSGSSTIYAPGVYGTLGTPGSSNVPGSRFDSISWIDSSGNLWLFGGDGYDSTGADGFLNDLWEFNPTTKQWTWVSGSNTVNANYVYGTLGVPASTNVPGGRLGAVSWTDGSGNLWLFGGGGYAPTGGYLNDLWEYSPTTKEWTWISGSSTINSMGVYGTLGEPAPSNVPGNRESAVSWIDSSGNLWLFGGICWGPAPTGSGLTEGGLNDLWEYSAATKQWTWMSGSSTMNAGGVYGTLGMPASTNVPGSRLSAVSWIDGSGNLWLFGGNGMDASLNDVFLNDLWEYSPTTKEWTWVSGSNTGSGSVTVGVPGVYGTLGVPAVTNIPGGRMSSVRWIDSSGNLWLFGGSGYDSTGTFGTLNDLWEFSRTSKEWTWMSGSNTIPKQGAGQPGVYGTLGEPAITNVPGNRFGSISWIDSSGNLWLFGGVTSDAPGGQDAGWINDLWRYQP